jgi:hypothetical protein
MDSWSDTRSASAEKLVRGYKVRISRQKQSPEEVAKRREAIGKIVTRSLKE